MVAKAQPQHCYDVSIGTSQAHISFIVSLKDGYVQSDLYIRDNLELYNTLLNAKDEIEKNTGSLLDWHISRPTSIAKRITEKSFQTFRVIMIGKKHINGCFVTEERSFL